MGWIEKLLPHNRSLPEIKQKIHRMFTHLAWKISIFEDAELVYKIM